MTLEQFLVELSKLHGWYRNVHIGCIERKTNILECPLTAVANANGNNFRLDQYDAAGWYLGFSEDMIAKIANAADNDYQCDKGIREALLEATNLNEV